MTTRTDNSTIDTPAWTKGSAIGTPSRTDGSIVNSPTRTKEQSNITNENILFDVNGINIFDVNGEQIYVIVELVPYKIRTDQFTPNTTVRS